MAVKEKIRHIAVELKGHAPFTIFGAMTGIALMLIFKNSGSPFAHTLFNIFHPGHVLLSAMVTASIFQLHRKAKSFRGGCPAGQVNSTRTLKMSGFRSLREKLDVVKRHLSSRFSLPGKHSRNRRHRLDQKRRSCNDLANILKFLHFWDGSS